MLKKESKPSEEKPILPQARNKDVVIQETGDEILVYDLINDKAHHLNETLSIVWSYRDGKTNVELVADILAKKLKVNVNEDLIWVALNELEKSDLLKDAINKKEYTRLSRRKILFNYALPLLVIPIIMTLVMPSQGRLAPTAASCLPLESNCNPTLPSYCSGLFCNDLSGQCEQIVTEAI